MRFKNSRDLSHSQAPKPPLEDAVCLQQFSLIPKPPTQLSGALSMASDSHGLETRLDGYYIDGPPFNHLSVSTSLPQITLSLFVFLFCCRLERRRKRTAKWMLLVGVSLLVGVISRSSHRCIKQTQNHSRPLVSQPSSHIANSTSLQSVFCTAWSIASHFSPGVSRF